MSRNKKKYELVFDDLMLKYVHTNMAKLYCIMYHNIKYTFNENNCLIAIKQLYDWKPV